MVRREADGSHTDITPAEYYIRTRVHEYGGRAYVLGGTYFYFVNFQDQRIYKQNLKHIEDIQPLTPKRNKDGSLGKYAALTLSPDLDKLLVVYEKEHDGRENENFLALIDLSNKKPAA